MLILLINTGLYVAMMLRTTQQGGSGFSDPRYPDAGRLRRQVRTVYHRTRGMVAPDHRCFSARRRASYPDEFLGAVRSRPAGERNLRDAPFPDDLFGLFGDGLFGQPVLSPAVSIGASAGLCGLIGAMIALGTRYRSAGAAIRRQYIHWMIYLLIFGLIIPNVDNSAHLGGLAGGFVLAYVAGTPGSPRRPKPSGVWPRVCRWPPQAGRFLRCSCT